jgi:hypothetical protein
VLILAAALLAVATTAATQVPAASSFDPVQAGEVPPGYYQSVPRGVIRAVYEPEFVAADRVRWPDSTLVIGIAHQGIAKAYPVSFLNFREMVNDKIGDWPILVSW